MKLNKKQKTFCREYIVDFNAGKAAVRAGYSKNGSRVQGHRLLTNANVQAYIYHLKQKRLSKIDVDAAFVINGLKKIAIESFDEGSKLKAFDLLGKHVGIYDKDNTQKAQVMTFKMNVQ